MARQFPYEQQRRLADMRLCTALATSIPELTSYAEHKLVIPLPNFSNIETFNAYYRRGRRLSESVVPSYVEVKRFSLVYEAMMAAAVTLEVGNNPYIIFDQTDYPD